MSKNFGKATDLIDFSRSSGGTALRKISYGPELVTNGTFDTDTTGWSVFAGDFAAVSGQGVLTYTGASATVSQQVDVTAGKVYRVTGQLVSATSATPRLKVGSSAGATDYGQLQAVGEIDLTIVATTSVISLYVQTLASGNTAVDNVSVKEVLFDQADGDLVVFNHPADIPRIEYAADGSVKGLLVEEARTNLIVESNDFSTQSAIRATATDNAAVSPDGSSNAARLEDTTDLGDHRLDLTGFAVTSGTTYTFSVYAKAAELNWIRLSFSSDFGTAYENFDLSSGTTGFTAGLDRSSIEDMGNGWYRCSITAAATASASSQQKVQLATANNVITYTGDGASGVYLYGAQFEAGAFPTSYIPTSGATATRSADVASIDTSAFGYRQAEGTLFASYYAFSGQGSTVRIASLNDVSASNSFQMALLDAGTTYHEVRSGGAAVVTTVLAGAITDNALTKTAVASSLDDHAGATNGGTVGTDTSGAMPIGVTTLNIGSHYSGNFPFNGHIKSLKYYPRRLTNAQLQELTT